MSSSETRASSEYLEYYELFNTADDSFPAMNPPPENSVPQYKFHNPTGSPSKINPNPVPTIVITTETQTSYFETGYLVCFRCRNNLAPPTDPLSRTHGIRPQSSIGGNNRRASMPAKMQVPISLIYDFIKNYDIL